MKQKYLIFGAGHNGKRDAELLGVDNVVAFIDNYPREETLTLTNERPIPIYTPEEAVENVDFSKCVICISSDKYMEEMQGRLHVLNLPAGHAFSEIWLGRQLQGNTDKRIFLLNTHSGINIGDHLISLGEISFLKHYFSDYAIIEVPQFVYMEGRKYLKQVIKSGDVLLISGGGYLGSLWMPGGENNVRDIIQRFPDNPVIILSQSMYFEDTEKGKEEREKSRRIYSAHPDLTICLRDRKSYVLSTELFGANVKSLYFPDMALILKSDFQKKKEIPAFPSRKDEPLDDVLFCLRKDVESKVSDNTRDDLHDIVKSMHLTYKETDMECTEFTPFAHRNEIVSEKINEFQKYRLVITDRLHAMILSYITGTPCIAFDNLTGKVSGVYHWIDDCGYIKVLNHVEEVKKTIEDLLSQPPKDTSVGKTIQRHYEHLAQYISDLLQEKEQ